MDLINGLFISFYFGVNVAIYVVLKIMVAAKDELEFDDFFTAYKRFVSEVINYVPPELAMINIEEKGELEKIKTINFLVNFRNKVNSTYIPLSFILLFLNGWVKQLI